MKDQDKTNWLNLIYGYEELDADEKRKVDAVLADDEALRSRLHRLQELEKTAAEVLDLPDEDFYAAPDLGPDDREALKTSLDDLIRKLDLQDNPAQPQGAGWRTFFQSLRPRLLVPVAVAVGLFILIFSPFDQSGKPVIEQLDLVTYALDNGHTRDARIIDPGSGELRNGQAFGLSMTLTRDAYLALVHIDPTNQIQLVYPETSAQAARLFEGGDSLTMPDLDGDELWILSGDPGEETFVVASCEEPLSAVTELRDSLAALSTEAAGDRVALLALIQDLFGAGNAETRVIDFRHID
jgi:Domain of unknown function (DUF4384)